MDKDGIITPFSHVRYKLNSQDQGHWRYFCIPTMGLPLCVCGWITTRVSHEIVQNNYNPSDLDFGISLRSNRLSPPLVLSKDSSSLEHTTFLFL